MWCFQNFVEHGFSTPAVQSFKLEPREHIVSAEVRAYLGAIVF